MDRTSLDNWITGGRSYPGTIRCTCPDGHEWEAPAYTETGGWFFADEEAGPCCPGCDSYDVDSITPDEHRPSDDGLIAPMGYVRCDDGVYRFPDTCYFCGHVGFSHPDCPVEAEMAEAEALSPIPDDQI